MKRFFCILISLILTLSLTLTAFAATKSQLQKDKEANQSKLDQAQSKADEIAGNKAAAQADVDESQQQLVELLSNVAILEDDIKKKDEEITKAKSDYDAAAAEEQKIADGEACDCRHDVKRGKFGDFQPEIGAGQLLFPFLGELPVTDDVVQLVAEIAGW